MSKSLFPIRIKSTKSFIDEFSHCEEPSYCDMLDDEQRGNTPEVPTDLHTYTVLKRHKTVIRINNSFELGDVFYRLGSGLIRENNQRQAERIQRELLPYARIACPDVVDHWTIPGVY